MMHPALRGRLHWRDRNSYSPLLDLDRSGWAWEFLRRNPDYRDAVRSHTKPMLERWLMPPLSLISAAGISPDWGLSFRRFAS